MAPPLRAVPAPERADTRIRVGVLRPQPAGARLGRVARLQHGSRPNGEGRPAVLREVLPQATHQLRLVGEQG